MDALSPLEKVIKKANDTFALMAQLSMSHEILKSDFKDAINEIKTKTSLELHQSDHSGTETKIDFLKSEFQKIKQDLFNIKNNSDTRNNNFSSNIEDIKNYLINCKSEIFDLKKNSNILDKKINDVQKLAYIDLSKNIQQSKKEINEKIENLPIPTDAVNLDQVRDQINNLIEPVRREMKNVLNAMYAQEQRLILFDKKINEFINSVKSKL